MSYCTDDGGQTMEKKKIVVCWWLAGKTTEKQQCLLHLLKKKANQLIAKESAVSSVISEHTNTRLTLRLLQQKWTTKKSTVEKAQFQPKEEQQILQGCALQRCKL